MVFGDVRAEKNRIDFAAFFLNLCNHFLMNLIQHVHIEETPTDARLIGSEDDPEFRTTKSSYGLKAGLSLSVGLTALVAGSGLTAVAQDGADVDGADESADDAEKEAT